LRTARARRPAITLGRTSVARSAAATSACHLARVFAAAERRDHNHREPCHAVTGSHTNGTWTNGRLPRGRHDIPLIALAHSRASVLPPRWRSSGQPCSATLPRGRERADRAAIHEAQPGFLVPAAGGLNPADQQAVAGQRLGVGIILRDRLFDQSQGLVRLSPGRQGWPRQARPPGLVLEAEGPGRVGRRQVDQAVARALFRAYAGSGLVSQRLARFQPTPRRLRVARIVSPLTRLAGRSSRPCGQGRPEPDLCVCCPGLG
jgi:hypothetical protein